MATLASQRSGQSAACMPMGLPCGRRSPRGKLRWYLVHVPEGREQSICDKVRKVVDPDLLDDAFVMLKESWFKRDGVWMLKPVQMYREYFFVATRDVAALDKALSRLSFPARVVGADGHAYAPLASEAQEWFSGAMDERHVLRNSMAVIENGRLNVQNGPLRGQESRVRKIDRHRRRCTVAVCDADGGFTEQMPIDVPFKS